MDSSFLVLLCLNWVFQANGHNALGLSFSRQKKRRNEIFVVVRPEMIHHCFNQKQKRKASSMWKKEVGMRQNRKFIKIDAHGGHGGTFWDDGAFTGIREVTLVYDHCIDSIRIEYDLNGKPVLAEKHGGAGGQHTAHVKLQYPDEFLTMISGYLSPVVRGGTPVVRSLTFKSNKRSWGPYGVEQGTPFSFSMDGGAIVGFHGRSGWYLDSIGFRLAPLHNRGSLQDMFRQKLRSFGALASRTLGYNDVEEGNPVRTAKVSS